MHYYDPKTQTEHVFGIGHMLMKVQEAGIHKVATVRGHSLLGFSTGLDESGGHFALGWDSNRSIHILQADTAIELLWPNNDLLNVRIGDPFTGQNQLTPNPRSHQNERLQ